ncbi:MAG: 50S ribosomal protein L30 [Anaerolineae bacterium]|nr:50S ribosomal protein L30 [Anaerolineae bacterium]
MAKMLRIKLVRSPIGYSVRQKATAKALGLRKMHQVVLRPDNPAVRGMVASIAHLVQVEPIESAGADEA